MLSHLETAHSLAEELGEAISAYLIERALDEIRAGHFSDARQTTKT